MYTPVAPLLLRVWIKDYNATVLWNPFRGLAVWASLKLKFSLSIKDSTIFETLECNQPFIKLC